MKIAMFAASLLLVASTAHAETIWQRWFHGHAAATTPAAPATPPPADTTDDGDAYGIILSAAAQEAAQQLVTIGEGIGSILSIAGGTDQAGQPQTGGTCTLVADQAGHDWCQYNGVWYLYGGLDATTGQPIYYYQTASGWVRL